MHESNNQIAPQGVVPPAWIEIRPDQRGLWKSAGVFTITHVPSQRHFFVGTTSLSRRLRDNHAWLRAGTHKNRSLQEDWDRNPAHFRWYLVERMNTQWLLPNLKQNWIDRFAKTDACYNTKNAVPKARAQRPRHIIPSLPLRPLLEATADEPEDWFDRHVERLMKDAAEDPAPMPASPTEAMKRARAVIEKAKRLLASS